MTTIWLPQWNKEASAARKNLSACSYCHTKTVLGVKSCMQCNWRSLLKKIKIFVVGYISGQKCVLVNYSYLWKYSQIQFLMHQIIFSEESLDLYLLFVAWALAFFVSFHRRKFDTIQMHLIGSLVKFEITAPPASWISLHFKDSWKLNTLRSEDLRPTIQN